MQVLYQRNFKKLLCQEQDLETSVLNNVLKQPRLHIISKKVNVLASEKDLILKVPI